MKKLIPKLRLGTDKTTTAVNRIAIRQSDRGEEIHAFITTDTNEPYNLNNKYLVFKENKITGTAVRDNNVSITDASNGEISYTLHDAVHGADGVAWFDIVDSSNDQLIDSTADFYIKARDGLKFTALDVSYMSDLDKIKEELSKRISEEVDQQTADKLQQWKSNVDSAIQTMQQSYASVVDDFNSKYNQRYESITNSFNQVQSQIDTANSKISDAISNATNDVEQAKNSMQQNYANIVNDFDSKYKQQYNSITESFNQVKNKVDGYNQAVQDFNNRIDTTVSNANSRLDTVVNNAKNRVDTTITNAESTLKNASDKAGETNKQLEQLVQDAKGKADSVNETLENLKQRTQKQEEDFNKVVVDTNNKVDTAINKIPDEIDKNLNAKDARVQELQNSITKLKDDVTAFDGKTKKQFEDIENHIKEVSNGIAHLDLSKYATKDDLKSYQPDLSKLVVKTKILTGQNELKRVEFSPYKKNNGSFAVNIEYNDFTKQHLKNLLVKDLPKIQENIGNLQTTKADKSELSNYATKNELSNKTERPLFEAMLQNYATKSELNNHQVDLSNYATKSDLDHKADRSDFSYYATKNELDNKADKSELSSYATKDDLNNHQVDLSNYATKSDLDNKVDRSDLNNYAYETQKALSNKANSSELDSYATKGDLDNKADKSELSNYATTGDIKTAIQNVRIKQDFLGSDNTFTSGKIYSPNLVDGHLTFDMSDSYATYKTKSLASHVSAMQEQITQLQLEVKKKIKLRQYDMILGTLYADEKKVVFNMANFEGWRYQKFKGLILNTTKILPEFYSSADETLDPQNPSEFAINIWKGDVEITDETIILKNIKYDGWPTGTKPKLETYIFYLFEND